MSASRRVTLAALLAVCCLLAGCGYFAGPTPGRTSPTAVPATPTPTPPSPPSSPGPTPSPDAPDDRLGWEAGYAATDPLAVNASDGLNASEREAVVARTMARVELIRGLEFTEPVPVEVVSREVFHERDVRFVERRDPRVTEAFWEALFLVGEDGNATAAVSEVFGGGVVGYYTPTDGGRIVLVSDDDSPRVDTGTLAHELVHALQDRHFDRNYDADTFDARVGTQGLTEGDPVYVERTYRSRCGGEWSCLDVPRTRPNGDAIARHPGVYLAFVQPYVTGAGFVEALRNRSGGDWTAVNDAYADPPRASGQVIRPERYPDDRPANATVRDRSGPNWTHVGRETAGESGVHVMFWSNGFVERGDSRVDTDYRHRLSTGWEGDALVVYARNDGSVADADGEDAYVWRLVWENESEARAFERAYGTLLRLHHGGREVAPRTYLVEDGPFADAFRMTRTGDTVTVVNAPTVEDLEEVHAS
ncbi:MAG: Hvo_1808 family surface protein [Haloarculaceae archaeon]